MGNYYLLRDGLISDPSTYGASVLGSEKTNSSDAYTLTTSDSWSTALDGISGEVIDSIAVHVSSRAATPVGTLTLSVSSGIVSPTIVGTYPISSFTSYDGSNNTVASYPLNWQLLKLSSPFTNSTGNFKLNLKTSDADQLTLMGLSTVNGIDYDRMAVLSGDFQYGSISKVNVTTSSDYPPFTVGTDSSMSFNGTTSYAESPGSSDLDFGTGNFTIEFWIKVPVSGNAHADTILTFGNTYLANNITFFVGNISNNPNYLSVYTGAAYLNNNTTVPINDNLWHHVALTRSGVNIVRLFIDGSQVGLSAASSQNFNNGLSYGLRFGSLSNVRFAACNLSNIRITKGISLYDADFTRPFEPFDLISPSLTKTCVLYKATYDTYISNTTVDNIHIGSVIDGYTTQNRTITAATTVVGNVYVHKNGLLKFSNTSTTLSAVGVNGLQATSEGTIQVGSSASPVPNNTTHEIILSGNHIGVSTGGRLDVHGAYKVPYTKLTSPSISTARTFTVDDEVSTNWQVNDTLIYTPNTTQTASYDVLALSSFDSNSTFRTTTSAAFAHSILDYVPSVANLTRNVKIRGASNTLKGNIQARGGAYVNVNNTEFKFIDGSLSTGVNNNGLFSVSGCTLSGSGIETILTPIATEFSANFNGTTSWITGGAVNNTDFDVNVGTDFTLELFFKVIADGGTPQLLFRVGENIASENSNTGCYIFLISNSYIKFGMVVGNDQKEISSPVNSIKKNKWYHVAVVGRNNIVTLYLNGVYQSKRTQVSWNFNSNSRYGFSYYNYNGKKTYLYKGMMSNMRFVKGRAMYTSNFKPPTAPLTEITDVEVSTALLTLQDSVPVDNSYRNAPLTLNNITAELDSPLGKKSLNVNVINNVLFKTQYGLLLDNVYSENSTISDNLLLSSKDAGIYINDGLKGVLNLNRNISVGPSPYGSLIENNTSNVVLSGLINYSNTYGMYVNNSHIGVINNVVNTYNTIAGVIVDGTIAELNETTFSDITASNNRTIGFLVSGNVIDHLSPVIININGLVANDNLSGGFEGYCIAGNLSSLELNRNGFYGMKTSIANYNTTIDGVTALMNNVATTSAAIGILSGICYYPILIKNANVGKSVSSSVFGAGISLDSTKFSEFSVDNSTVSGGSSDFQLKTTRSILEGSYLISNTNVGVLPVGVGISTTNYQSDVLKTTGFAFTNMNNITGYHVTYLAAGNRSIDSTITCNINETTSPSERLTPQSNIFKLRSGSKFVALNEGESTSIQVYVRKSTLATNGVEYNGTAPRLILKRNGALGINSDVVMGQLDAASENFLKLSGTTPVVTDDGVLEFYIDCDGTQGWINIDNWTAN